MSDLHQIQVAYEPEQDRLLLRASARDGVEFRFWLTRRLVKGLWPALQEALSRELKTHTPGPPAAQREVLQFRREQAVRQADFATPYEEPPGRTHPLGEEPLLVVRVSLAPPQDGRYPLTLLPREGQGCNLALTEPLLLSLTQVLEQAVSRSGWDLELSPAPGDGTRADGPGRLN